MTPLEMVREFHRTFQLPILESPGIPPKDRRRLRKSIMREEWRELKRAMRAGDIVAVADACSDLTYTVYGTALEYGIDLDACIEEVHRSNMSKVDENGTVLRSDGKVLKGPWYSPPNLAKVLWP